MQRQNFFSTIIGTEANTATGSNNRNGGGGLGGLFVNLMISGSGGNGLIGKIAQ